MPHLLVLGAGIIGLSSARAAQRRGWRVTLVDRDFEGDRASHGNAGAIANGEPLPLSLAGLGLQPLKWLLDPLGPLSIRPSHAPRLLPWFLALRRASAPAEHVRLAQALAALNQRALPDFKDLVNDLGMSAALRPQGALAVYESAAGFAREAAQWQHKRELGVRWREIGLAELQAMEPALAPVFAKAVLLEDWAHVSDPRRIVSVLRERLQADGATLVPGEAEALDLREDEPPAVIVRGGQRHASDKLLVATGAWSAPLARSAGDRALLESERGYNTTLPGSVGLLKRQLIFAERQFVATPLDIGLRIGGAAEFAGLTAPANYARSDALLTLARRCLRGLDEQGAQRWMGQRPSTPDSLPVIGPSPRHPGLLYAFGHGHLGLTQSATTAVLIGALLDGETPAVDLAPYAITRF